MLNGVILHEYENEIRIIGLLIWLCYVKEIIVEISLCMFEYVNLLQLM